MTEPGLDYLGWTLFLDRDGVINRRIMGGYITKASDFELLTGVGEAISILSKVFSKTLVVTNQQGIGKGIMSEKDLEDVHHEMTTQISKYNGKIDAIYFCPFLSKDKPSCRKPNTGMADQAIEQFPDINFSKCLMIGDSPSDIEFGIRKGMKTILIRHEYEQVILPTDLQPNYESDSLLSIARDILNRKIELVQE